MTSGFQPEVEIHLGLQPEVVFRQQVELDLGLKPEVISGLNVIRLES